MSADPPAGRGQRDPANGPSVDPDLLERAGQGPRGEVWPAADVLLTVSVGGVIGAVLRYGLTRLIPPDGLGIPWATLTANVAGSLLLGLLTAMAIARYPTHRYLRPFLGVGLLGSFTTYSTLAVELDTRLGQGRGSLAVAYGLISVSAGVAAAALGLWAGRRSLRL